jgi:hypothetical protein
VRPGRVRLAELLEALTQREMGVVRRRVDVEERLERRARALVLARVVVGAAQGFQDRGLARLLAIGPLEDSRSLGEVAPLQERRAALEKLVGGLVFPVVGSRVALRPGIVVRLGGGLRVVANRSMVA